MRPLRAFPAAVVAVLIFAPAVANAGLRGAYDPITNDSKLPNGFEQPAFRPVPAVNGVERFFSFSTRSLVLRYEASREIWLHVLASRAGFNLTGSALVAVRVPLLRDPTGQISYIDPAWSPDGRFLAYAETDRYFSHATLYVQEFRISDVLSEAATPVGDRILVVSGADGSHNRHPAWSPDGSTLAFDSDRSGGSLDIYTVQVFPAVGAPIDRSGDSLHADQSPAWSPDGTRLVYTSNAVGPEALYILDLTRSLPDALTRVETQHATTARHNPVWSRDGTAIYYDAASLDEAERVADVFRLDLATGERCAIYVDDTADWDPDVSRYPHVSPDGIPFDYFLFSSMAAPFISRGPNVWRGEYIQNCIPPLRMGVDFQPNSIKIGASGQDIVATLRFPPETKAAGYQCQSFDGPLEGVRMRVLLLPSPTLLGLPAKGDRQELRLFGDAVTPQYRDYTVGSDPRIDVRFDRSQVESVLVAAGLTNRTVSIPVEAYSNGVGRRFSGFGYLKVSSSSLASGLARDGSGAARWLSASPNPFNPSTTLRFRVEEPGEAILRVFDARGRIVRTLLRQWLPAGEHEARWDGRDERGGEVASGLYFAQIAAAHGVPDRLKIVLMK